MPSFRWSAINGGGDTVSGVMEAPDRGVVVERLQRQGHLVLRADPADRRRGLRELLQVELGGARGLEKAALGEVTRELAIMLAAGQDLDRALRFVVDNTRSARARAILGNVRDKVRSTRWPWRCRRSTTAPRSGASITPLTVSPPPLIADQRNAGMSVSR